MSYTKVAIVSTVLSRNNLTVWKAYMTEIHNELIASGLVQTGDTGQLDISAVGSLPADAAYAGYRMYLLDDPISLAGHAIYIKLEFGCGQEGTSPSNANQTQFPFIRVTLGAKTDGAGAVFAQDGVTAISPALQFICPQNVVIGSAGSISGTPPAVVNMYICRNDDRGFYGFVFAANGRGGTGSTTVQYNASSLCLLIQRTLDSAGAPTTEGFTVYHNMIGSAAASSVRWPSVSSIAPYKTKTLGFSYINASTQFTLDANVRPGGVDATPISGQIQTGPCYTYHKELRLNPNMVTYRTQDMFEGTQFEVETSPGISANFIALGPGSGIFPDAYGQQTSYAMLFE